MYVGVREARRREGSRGTHTRVRDPPPPLVAFQFVPPSHRECEGEIVSKKVGSTHISVKSFELKLCFGIFSAGLIEYSENSDTFPNSVTVIRNSCIYGLG